MKKYIAFFRLRFSMGLQYRSAALAGMATQFFWGTMEILMFRAFYRADPGAFPMTLEATCSYVWLQQAFLALFMAWVMENEIFDSILNGNVAYELCRPVNIYNMWFSRNSAKSGSALYAYPVSGSTSACPLRADDSCRSCGFIPVFPNPSFRSGCNCVLLYAGLYALLFYPISHGIAYRSGFYGGIFFRRHYPPALPSGRGSQGR